jgi:hypothetical protein
MHGPKLRPQLGRNRQKCISALCKNFAIENAEKIQPNLSLRENLTNHPDTIALENNGALRANDYN